MVVGCDAGAGCVEAVVVGAVATGAGCVAATGAAGAIACAFAGFVTGAGGAGACAFVGCVTAGCVLGCAPALTTALRRIPTSHVVARFDGISYL
jgi:hypothetical protein